MVHPEIKSHRGDAIFSFDGHRPDLARWWEYSTGLPDSRQFGGWPAFVDRWKFEVFVMHNDGKTVAFLFSSRHVGR